MTPEVWDTLSYNEQDCCLNAIMLGDRSHRAEGLLKACRKPGRLWLKRIDGAGSFSLSLFDYAVMMRAIKVLRWLVKNGASVDTSDNHESWDDVAARYGVMANDEFFAALTELARERRTGELVDALEPIVPAAQAPVVRRGRL